MGDLPASFMEKVVVLEDGCWQWTGGRYGNGYGRYKPAIVTSTGRDSRVLAHRFSYEVSVGPIRNVINHLCENKGCVNPAHLEDVTQKENVRYSLGDSCVRGHDLTPGNPNVLIDVRSNKRKCRACMRDAKRREYARTPDKLLARAHAYYYNNRESVLAQKREYYLKNRDAILARRRERSLSKKASQA